MPGGIGGTAVVLVCYAMWLGDRSSGSSSMSFLAGGGMRVRRELGVRLEQVALVLLSAFIVVGAISVARGQPGPAFSPTPLRRCSPRSTSACRSARSPGCAPIGRRAAARPCLLLMVVIVVSDSAQYYTGRAFGRRPLSPTISPKKTLEGAIGGLVFGTLAMVVGGRYVFDSPIWILALLGAAISLLGIVGDLFESLLKRSAGVKDSSNLIPGHGGVLDRIDSWLFAAPVYYVFVRFVA